MNTISSNQLKELERAFEFTLIMITILSAFFSDVSFVQFYTGKAPIPHLIRFLIFPVVLILFVWLLKFSVRDNRLKSLFNPYFCLDLEFFYTWFLAIYANYNWLIF